MFDYFGCRGVYDTSSLVQITATSSKLAVLLFLYFLEKKQLLV